MLKFYSFFIYVLIIFKFVFLSANPAVESGPRIMSLAGAGGVSEIYDPLSLNYNPALIKNTKNKSININYLRLNNIEDLYKTSFSLLYPNFPVALLYTKQNFDAFNEETFSVSLGTKIEKIDLGVNLKNIVMNKQNFTMMGIGSIYTLSNYKIYFASRNLSLDKNEFYVDKNFSVGLTFFPVTSTQLNIEYFFDKKDNDIIFSQESTILNNYFLRYGIQTKSNRYGLGAGVKFYNFIFDYGLLTHPILDPTHSFSLSYVY